MNKIKFTFASLATVMIITVLGCTNSPVSDPNRVKSSSELATGSTTTWAKTTVLATVANSRTDIPTTNKIGTREGYTAPKFTLPMSDGNTRVFPSNLEKGYPVFLLFFTPH